MALTFTCTAQHGCYFYMHSAARMLLLHALRSMDVTFTCIAQPGNYFYMHCAARMLLAGGRCVILSDWDAAVPRLFAKECVGTERKFLCEVSTCKSRLQLSVTALRSHTSGTNPIIIIIVYFLYSAAPSK